MPRRTASTNVAAVALLLVAALSPPAGAAEMVEGSFGSGGGERTYVLAVPDALAEGSEPADSEEGAGGEPVPLLILFHGSGRDGRSQVVEWRRLAEKNGFLAVGPDSADSEYWGMPEDGPEMLRDLVEHLGESYPVDPRRVYLFGHSGGASFALKIALLESRYFAAAAVHAGALRSGTADWMPARAKRPIPLHLAVGTEDRFFPLSEVRETHDALVAAGLPAELVEIPRHDHDYYGRSKSINQAAWEFLSAHALEAAPEWERHRFQ